MTLRSFGLCARTAVVLAARVVTLLAKAGFGGGERRPCCPPSFGALTSPHDELGELCPRVLEIALPVARRLADEQNAPLCIEPPTRQRAQPGLRFLVQHPRIFEVESQLHF